MNKHRLTPEQRAKRRVGRQYVVDAVACPKCGMEEGIACEGARHPIRLSPHLERIQAYSKEKRREQTS